MDKILQMLLLQQQLNDATNGENWEEGVTKNGKKINWKRCIYMECAEMIDSFSWKHWKNIDQEPDWENHQIEVVDVWHFIMSLALEQYRRQMLGSIDTLALNISQLEAFQSFEEGGVEYEVPEVVMEQVEELMLESLLRQGFDLNRLFENFFKLASMSHLNMQALYRLYVGKNILNQFRQDNGYKEGSYIKVWAGEEDNVVMKRIWEENGGNLKPETLYRELSRYYHELTKV